MAQNTPRESGYCERLNPFLAFSNNKTQGDQANVPTGFVPGLRYPMNFTQLYAEFPVIRQIVSFGYFFFVISKILTRLR